MSIENGNLSIHAENFLPIIKKWLYSEKDIFIRELVSNSNDAISKFKKLVSMGEAEADENPYKIRVVINKGAKTIQVIDNGIGMTAEEVRKYINQIAFSGAVDFLEKYQDKTDEGDQIIGHFGLGFYSAFMVSEKVCIDTLSFQKGAEAVKWTSEGGMEYTMEPSDRTERGTAITLHVMEDSVEYLEYETMRAALEKYCSFLPYEIYLEDIEKIAEEAVRREEAAKKKETENKDKDENTDAESYRFDESEFEDDSLKPINDTHPLWLKNPKDCTEDEYKSFYRKVFNDFDEPLFWIHLNMDYPFNLKGILYFPKLKHEFETMEGQIKLYYNQVFVADNIKEVIPEFLLLLKGVIDCPDLPLNVSRSFLQNDSYVSKISSHITKKVADKLSALYENERENYNKYWSDINPFVKYGCIRESKFFDKVKDIVIYKTTNGDFVTLKDYLERNREKHENKVFYVTDERQQAQYIKLFKDHGMEAIILSHMIDSHFMQFLEMKDRSVSFSRVDSDISDSMRDKDAVEDDKSMQEGLEKLFRDILANDKLKVKVEALKASNVPGMILLSEYARRMQEMSRMYGGMDMNMGDMFQEEQTLVLNRSNSLIKTLAKLKDDAGKKDDVDMICKHIYDLAMMSHKRLEPDAMTSFIERSNLLLERLAEMETKAC
jgi:molecular chaperone HtpG